MARSTRKPKISKDQLHTAEELPELLFSATRGMAAFQDDGRELQIRQPADVASGRDRSGGQRHLYSKWSDPSRQLGAERRWIAIAPHGKPRAAGIPR
jgi:hypothetical protein